MDLYVRESHGVSCEACGFMWDEWDTGITLAEAVAQIVRDPRAVDDLQVRPCPRCGNRLEWDAAITESDRGTLGLSQQRRLAGTLRRVLRRVSSQPRLRAWSRSDTA
jgi:hypothetical protein